MEIDHADQHSEVLFAAVCASAGCSAQRRQTLEHVVELAVELAREGREGRKIGTLFVVGDTDTVLERSRPLMLDPLAGHPREARDVTSPAFRETARELAQLDGAFLVDDHGIFTSAARFIDVDLGSATFLPGLGTRHAAGMSISSVSKATSVVVSQSSVVRVFSQGKLRAEILPELFLMSKRRLVSGDADVHAYPNLGLTVAMAGNGNGNGNGLGSS